MIQLALQESTDGTEQRDEGEGADPAEQQLSVAFSFALETEKQAEAERGAKTECQIEIKHLVTVPIICPSAKPFLPPPTLSTSPCSPRGNVSPEKPAASITAAATTTRVNHLWSAGTTYHGACLVAVFWIMSS